MRRPEKIAEMVREEITQIVGYELEDPRVASVAVTDVRVTDNLRDARIFVTVEGTEAEKMAAMKALRHAAPYIRRQVGVALNLRYTPELHFVRDTVEESATRVDALLSRLQLENSLEPPAGEVDETGKEGDAALGRGEG